MAKKKKNKIIPLIALFAVVAIFIGAYFYISGLDLNAEPEDDTNVFAIQSKATDTLTRLEFNDKNGEKLAFVKNESVWYSEYDNTFPVNQTAVNDLLSAFGTILGTREFTEDNGEFGFDEPQNVVSLTYTDDSGETVLKYTIGDTNSFNSGTYLRDDVSGKMYLSSSNPAEVLKDKVRNDFIQLDIAAADVETNSTHTVTVTGTDGKKNVIKDSAGIDEFLGDPFGNIDCSDWVQYNCSDEDFAKYGITKGEDKPSVVLGYKTTVSVTDENGESTPKRTETTYSVWFGDTLEDGSVYYTIKDSSFVYKLSRDRYDAAMKYLTYEPAPETTAATTAVTE